MSVLLSYKNMFFLDFLEFWQAHSDPPIRLAGTNSDCGGLISTLLTYSPIYHILVALDNHMKRERSENAD